jgi:hypothetical protein
LKRIVLVVGEAAIMVAMLAVTAMSAFARVPHDPGGNTWVCSNPGGTSVLAPSDSDAAAYRQLGYTCIPVFKIV